MSARFEAPMLLIGHCADASRWYARHIGQVVPYRGFDKKDGFASTEPGGYSNFVRAEDAVLVNVTFTAAEAAQWPFSHVPRKMMESVKAKSHIAPGMVPTPEPWPEPPYGSKTIYRPKQPGTRAEAVAKQQTKAKGQSHAQIAIKAVAKILADFADGMTAFADGLTRKKP
jgi:hypothetical protein